QGTRLRTAGLHVPGCISAVRHLRSQQGTQTKGRAGQAGEPKGSISVISQGGESNPTGIETNTSHQAPLVPEGVPPSAPAVAQSADKSSSGRSETSFLALACLLAAVLGAGLFVAYANARGVEWEEHAVVVAGIVFCATLLTGW